MKDDETDALAGLVRVHQHLVRAHDGYACGSALYPEPRRPATDWRPTFGHEAYRAADPSTLGLRGTESFHDLADETVEAAILKVVDVEGPVHFRVLAERLLTAADVGRLGSRIRERIAHHIDKLEKEEAVVQRDNCVGRRDQIRAPRVRDRCDMRDKLRDLDYVPEVEIMQALFQAVLDAEGVSVDDAMSRCLDLLGFERLTDNARDHLWSALSALIEREVLREEDGQLWLARDAFVRLDAVVQV
jgi:hypothetical protein